MEGAVRQFLRSILGSLDRDRSAIQRINAMRSEFTRMSDDQLRTRHRKPRRQTGAVAVRRVAVQVSKEYFELLSASEAGKRQE